MKNDETTSGFSAVPLDIPVRAQPTATENKMQAEEAKDEDLKRLRPCPFCGGGITEFHDNWRVWAGMKYSDPISVSVRHWCAEIQGPSRSIERIGRDKEQAIERWNMRSSAEITGSGEGQ